MLLVVGAMSRPGGCRLDELDEYPAAVLRVGEVDEGAGGAAPRRVIEHADARGGELLGRGNDVIDPGPDRSRNFAIVESGVSGASSWMQLPESPTPSIASRTPCSSFTSSWTTTSPKARR